MPRAPRIEYEGAIYHVMARGNRREPIVFGDEDREMFVETFGEACVMAGWQVFAWVLMDNHYHAVFRTPEPNLVEGMRWLQNAYTRRINSRHQLWGHLFGGRYRSILVENRENGSAQWRDYLRTVINYVHLNPGRAGLVDGKEKSLIDYPWSGIAKGYALSPKNRPMWMAVKEGLDLYGYRDTTAGRRKLVEQLDSWIGDEKDRLTVEEVPVSVRIKRGWFWGSEQFKEVMLERYESVKKGNKTYRSSATARDHGEKRAREIVREGCRHYGLSSGELQEKRLGDWRRTSVAWALKRETTVSQGWIAEELGMKSAGNVSQQVGRFEKEDTRRLPKEVRQWKKLRMID